MNERYTFIDIYKKELDLNKDTKVRISQVVIPKIQRPYAQGRLDGVCTYVRNTLLNEMFANFKTDEIFDFNFIYGIVRPSNDEYVMELLDGQQRMTTLFLVYWYIANRELTEADDSDKEGNLRVKLPIYNESTIANITNTGVSSEINTQQKYILIHEDEKNTKESELIGEGDCLSYSTRMLRIKNSVPEGSTCDSNPAFDNAFSDLESMCNEYRNSEIYVSSDGTTTDCGKLCSVMYDEVSDYCKERDESRGNSKYCGSLGNRIVNWIFKIIRYIRYGLPPVAIILSILDYIKAISSENDDDIKKTNGKVIKRLIAVALLFVIPFIISFILGLFDIPGLDASNPFCAK